MEHTRPKITFCLSLVENIPELQGILDQHKDEDYIFLCHNFLEDVFRWMMNDADNAKIKSLLGILELEFAKDIENTQELISVSFLENLWEADKASLEIELNMGPNLTRELEIIRGSKC